MGVAGGVVAGGAMGGVTGGFSRTQGLINDDVLLNRHSMGNNHWHTVGTYDDMVTVNRAFDGQPRRVEVSSPSGNQSVEVFGARNAREAATVQDALQRMRDVGADAGIPQQVHLRTDIGAITDAAGRRQGGIGGLGGDGTTMIVARDQLTNGRSAAHVIHHEAGHNVDTAFGRLTDTARGRALFGQGDSVSPYGALNRAEDFAETHRVLIRDWDRIMAEPDRYLDGSDIGRKLTFILDEVYGVNPRANAGGAAPAPATPSVRPQRSRIAPSGEAPTWRDVGEQHRTFLEAERRLATETRRLEHAQARLQTLQDGVADIEPRAYTNPGHHDPTSPNFRGGGSMTTHLPRDAEEVFARAIPEPGRHGDSWWARADSGDWYRYQGGRGDAVHWNGATGRTGGARAIQAHDVPGDIQTRWRLEQEMSGLQQRVGGLAEGVEDARFMYEYAESEFSDAANAVLRETGRPIDDSLRGMSWSQLRAVARDRGAGDLRTQARWLLDQVQARNPE